MWNPHLRKRVGVSHFVLDAQSAIGIHRHTHMEVAEKRHKRGDVREDGMVFWARARSCTSGEQWVTPAKYVEKCERNRAAQRASYTKIASSGFTRHPSAPRALTRKRGDTRPDGWVFWSYAESCRSGERWVPRDKYEILCERARRSLRKSSAKRQRGFVPSGTRKRGEVRESDGLVFWAYSAHAPGGEVWLTPSKYNQYSDKMKARGRAAFQEHKSRIVASRKDRYWTDSRFRVSENLRKRFKSAVSDALGRNAPRGDAHRESVEWLLWLAQRQGLPVSGGRRYEIDHLFPLTALPLSTPEEQAWANSPHNVRWLPKAENRAKGDALPTAIECFAHERLLTEYRQTLK